MKKIFYLFALIVIIMGCSEKQEYIPALNKTVLNEIDALEKLVEDFRKAGENPDTKTLQEHFVKSRLQYKKIEWAIEYFMPEPARFINGPALDELELEENREFPPHGFQVIEEMIYPEFDPANKKELQQELTILFSNTRQARKHTEAITISPDYAMDALRLQVYRVITLGITGFDSPVAQMSVSEVRGSLENIPLLLEQLKRKDNSHIIDQAQELINKAIKYCAQTTTSTHLTGQNLLPNI